MFARLAGAAAACLMPLLYLLLFAPSRSLAMDAAVARGNVCADDPQARPTLIEGYEPTRFGYTKQADDVGFVDFTLSVKAQLFRSVSCKWFASGGIRLYLAFTGRFGFYVDTRDSSPVLGKEYNPKLLLRWIPDPQSTTQVTGHDRKQVTEYTEYLDFAYAHSSNGQSIDTLEEYQIQAQQLRSSTYALDYISRGWDYLEVNGKVTLAGGRLGRGAISLYPDVKFFLRHGLFQGVPEEYHSWEQDSNLHPRHAFDGLDATLEYWPLAAASCSEGLFCKAGLRFAVKYTTGYDPVARYNTVRGEFGFLLIGLPVNIWVQDGYMNSLARYYLKARSIGIELRFAQF
jgi:outer membrane phospholipase A